MVKGSCTLCHDAYDLVQGILSERKTFKIQGTC